MARPCVGFGLLMLACLPVVVAAGLMLALDLKVQRALSLWVIKGAKR